jgi:hypothetical protein
MNWSRTACRALAGSSADAARNESVALMIRTVLLARSAEKTASRSIRFHSNASMRATFGIGHLIVGEQHIIDQSKTIDEVNGIAVLRLPALRQEGNPFDRSETGWIMHNRSQPEEMDANS